MVFAALLFFSPFPQIVETPKTVSSQTAVVSSISAKDSSHPAELPSMPAPKLKSGSPEAGDVADGTASTGPAAPVAPESSPTTQPPGNAAFQPSPLKPVITHPSETHREKTLWYALAITGHSAAALDAWSTRRALSTNAGTEANPFFRPFAHSGMLYAATQVSPLLMDYIGKRMMVSRHPMVRRVWWVPQAVGATVSFTAGVHNIGVVH